MFIVQCLNARAIAKLLCEIRILLMELIGYFELSSNFHVLKSISKFICKLILVGGAAHVTIIRSIPIIFRMMSKEMDYFVMILLSISHLLMTLVPNMFYGFIVGTTIQYERINNRIRQIMKNAERHIGLDELKKDLDYMAILHGRCTELTIKANRIFSLQLLTVMTSFVGNLLIEVRNEFEMRDFFFNEKS